MYVGYELALVARTMGSPLPPAKNWYKVGVIESSSQLGDPALTI